MRSIALAITMAMPLLAAAEFHPEPAAAVETSAEERTEVHTDAQTHEVIATAHGKASFYAKRFHGRRTASGERHDAGALTAAHRSLPFGTWVRVQSLHSDREVEVRINDRGPFMRGRIIDISRAAAESLGMLHAGTHAVKVQVLGLRQP